MRSHRKNHRGEKVDKNKRLNVQKVNLVTNLMTKIGSNITNTDLKKESNTFTKSEGSKSIINFHLESSILVKLFYLKTSDVVTNDDSSNYFIIILNLVLTQRSFSRRHKEIGYHG